MTNAVAELISNVERRGPAALAMPAASVAAARPPTPKAKRERMSAEQTMLRAESCLEKSVPLGYPPVARPESGPSVAAYYRAKHARGEHGQYYFHQVAMFTRRAGYERANS